jgi:TonB-linked SusC/RagA family outer membrane protein
MLTTLTIFTVRTYAQSSTGDTRVTLNMKNTPLKSVFSEITRQTKIYFLGNSDRLDQNEEYTINVENETVNNVLTKLLGNKGFIWTIKDNTVLIQKSIENILTNKQHIPFPIDTSISVSGIVINKKGEPIIGATVLVKGGHLGTTTTSNGSFKIVGVKPNASIVVTNVAYLTREIYLHGKNNIGSIQLEQYVSILDEAQIIAYGKTSRRLNTGNAVTINEEDIQKQPINNPLYALQGRVAGLEITPTSGLAGAAVNLQIRGNNSLNFKTEPLVVVDGLPIVNNTAALGHQDLSQISTLSFINPSEIESISVLKDADATSIYGSRGANGVILITTKKGKSGQTKINLNVQSGWGQVSKKIDVLNTQQYLQYRKESYVNRDIDIDEEPLSTANADIKYWNQNRYTDWQKSLIGGTAKYNDLQGSIMGGTATIQYLIGGNYHKETTVFPGKNSDQKGSGHLSLTGISPNEKFRSTVSLTYMSDHNTLPSIDYTNNAITLSPNAPTLYNPDGKLNWEPFTNGLSSWNNPLVELSRPYDAKVTNLVGSADFNYELLESLNLKLQLGYSELRGNSFIKKNPFIDRPPESINDDAEVSFNENSVKNLSIEPQLNYIININKSAITILIGGSIQSTNQQNEAINAGGYKSDALLKNLAAATNYYLTNSSSEYKYVAAFARLNYNWNGKYLINLTGRRDGSSRFGPGKQFGCFGSVGVAWIFTQEHFVRSAIPFISFGKLRFSYGSSGNDGIGDYAYLERYQSLGVTDFYQGTRGYTSTGLFNNDYAWEVTKKMEAGLETGFLKDRILFTVSYFRNRSNNQLIQYPFTSIAGPGQPYYNLPALIQNMGMEFTLNTENIKSKTFNWTTSFNLTRNRNKLLSYPDIQNSAFRQAQVGKPFYGDIRVYKSAGVNEETGVYQFKTIDGKITSNPQDFSRLDNGQYVHIYTGSKFYGGISNTFTYKNFGLDIFVQFNKQIGANPYSQYLLRSGRVAMNVPLALLNTWKESGDKTQFQKNGYNPFFNYLISTNNFTLSDWSYVNASFIRFKNISLSYSIPDRLIKSMKIQNMKFFMHGQNFFTITKYKGFDPETKSMGSLPPLRVITLGINMTM